VEQVWAAAAGWALGAGEGALASGSGAVRRGGRPVARRSRCSFVAAARGEERRRLEWEEERGRHACP